MTDSKLEQTQINKNITTIKWLTHTRTHTHLFQLYARACMCKHPHIHSLSHACNGIQNFLHAYAAVSVASAAVLLLLLFCCMHTRSAPRDRALQKQLAFAFFFIYFIFYILFFFTLTAPIMAAKKWQLLRRTIENELRVRAANNWKQHRASSGWESEQARDRKKTER